MQASCCCSTGYLNRVTLFIRERNILIILCSCILFSFVNKSKINERIHPVTYFSGYQGSYVDSSKVVGEVTAVDKDQDDKNSAFGELKYEFVNQTSEFITLNIV